MKIRELDSTNYCKTKSPNLKSLSKCFNQITITLDTFPLDIIKYIINLLGLVEKHVMRFVCKTIHSTTHRLYVLKKSYFGVAQLCPNAALNGYFEALRAALARSIKMGGGYWMSFQ
jgi:hypothetical protein